jgi:divalent metal cation (Fe/Co/Zn/Cd) transporter
LDLLDSLGNILRAAMVTLLSKKLTRDLRYEYNYGIGKIEAIVSLICDGIVFVGLILMKNHFLLLNHWLKQSM